MSDKCAAIQAHRERFPVRLMCAALGVSTVGSGSVFTLTLPRADAPA